MAVYFTHGGRRAVKAANEVTLGKAWLVSRLQALLHGGLLHLPKTAEAMTLAEELLDYEIRVDQNANDTYGAFKVGKHDDLVTALGLAVQDEPPRPFSAAVGGRRPVFGPPGSGRAPGQVPELLSMTPLGRAILRDRAGRAR